MEHTIECQARGTDGAEDCDACAGVGDRTPATVCCEEFDEGNGWQAWHYCQECADGLEDETP